MDRTKGAVALSRLALSQAEIARRVRRSRAAVGHWMTGQRRPGGDERAAMRREFGIEPELWEQEFNGAVALLHL